VDFVDRIDPARREWHERKMASKVSRPAEHLKVLGLYGKGFVQHILSRLEKT
jgi:hypothetical protein